MYRKFKGELLTPEDICARLKTNKNWLYLQTRQKGPDAIPRMYVGKFLRFNLDDVINWLERRQIQMR